MVKKDKKAWIKAIEAVFAVLIISSVILFLLIKPTKENTNQEIYYKEMKILELLSKNDNIRDIIVNTNNSKENNSDINDKIKLMVPNSFDFTTKICNLEDNCTISWIPLDKEIYVREIVVTSTLTKYNPKKLRLFLWFKENNPGSSSSGGNP
jgi:hypothetical protein